MEITDVSKIPQDLKMYGGMSCKKIAIVNSDDKYSSSFVLPNNNTITYGTKRSDFHVESFELALTETHVCLKNNGNLYNITIPFAGKYNIYNYFLALASVLSLGFKIEDVINITPSLKAPTGRTDVFKYNGAAIMVDYAHTPDAVENVINSALEYCKGKIFTVVGCGGDRDRTKRPKMGKIASENSTKVFFTNDNPRTEDEKVIIIFRNTSSYPLNISSDELLERFVRGDASRNTEGSGLGLSIAKQIANKHNIEISCKSIQGRGTSFLFRFNKEL